MIEVEENGKENRKRDCDKNISNTNIPEMYKPPSLSCWEERPTSRQRSQSNISHLPNMHEPREKDNCQGRSIVLDKNPDVVLKEWAFANDAAEVTDHQNQESDHNGEVECIAGSLASENLDPFLQIDKRHVKPKDIEGKSSDVFQSIARIRDGENPMHYQGPPKLPISYNSFVEA